MDFNKIFKSRIWPALWQLFSRTFILMGLPLLAWGLDDPAGFFSNPVRTSYIIIVAAQALLHAWMIYITPPQPHHEPRFDIARWHAYMFETIFVLAAFGDRRNALTWNENPSLRWLGLGIYLIGVGISVWANITWVNHLRNEGERAFDDPVLLFDGPFKWIRHPAFLSLIFYCLGFAIAYRSWVGLWLMIPLMSGIVNRIRSFERIYSVQYKKIWPLRRHTSKRIIPFLY